MTGRAETDEQKKHVMDRLLDAWKKIPELRLGQLINNAIGNEQNLFYYEDFDLVREAEQFAARQRTVGE
jgi:hypothetical protein